jgi:dipeptidyl aminopeptidase/acylaminoacyl peptidase
MFKLVSRIILTAFLFTAFLPSFLAEEKTPSGLKDTMTTLLAGKFVDQTVISPDGKRVAWVERLVENGVPTGKLAIYVADSHTGASPRRVTAGNRATPHREHDVAWSPDSKRLAFLSDAGQSGQQQLYVVSLEDGSARQMTNVEGFLASPGWSPNGATLAVLFTENVFRAAGPLVAETAQTGVIKESVTEQRLALVDVAGGQFRQISPADMYVYEYDWSPDSTRFVVTAAPGNGDNNWYIAQLYILSAADGTMKSIYKPPLQIAIPAWSPDGKSIAFIGGLMSDEGSVGGDVFVIPAEGGEPKNLTPAMKASASWLTWTPDGRRVLFGECIDGGIGFAAVEIANGRIETLWKADDQITRVRGWGAAVSLSADGKMSAMIRQSFARPPEVWTGPIGDWKQITSLNAKLKPAWGEARSIHWESEGFSLQGWLLYPRNFNPLKSYPMVVNVHGGPGAMVRNWWPGSQHFSVALSGNDYFVFFPNPRGSFGSGEAFTRANVRDFGYGDWRDILAGVDVVLKQAPVDPQRLGLMGWSYGGYMTMWGVTQTNRFRAAMAGAGIANFQSYYGENQIDQSMIPFFGASVYDDPKVYEKSSPITFIKNAHTPTLVVVGDSDGECPPPQSYEFWHALKTLGVETELVVYEHEGHSLSGLAHQRDLIERVTTWFDQHLTPVDGATMGKTQTP